MKIEQLSYSKNKFGQSIQLGLRAQLVFAFGSRELVADNGIFDRIRELYPNAYIMGCSSSGEIIDSSVTDNDLHITAVYLEKSNIIVKSYEIGNSEDYYEIGKRIISNVEKDELKHIFILSEGLNINGSQLVNGMKSIQNFNIPITGALAGDGTKFKKTVIIANDYATSNNIVVAAFYGEIKTGCASFGGWDTFGIERVVTKSVNNVLFEIDGKPVLDLYKEYLGEQAAALPSSALLFPLSVRSKNSDESYVRTILGVNEDEKSLIFAGDIPENSYCRFMKANTHNLVNGSKRAAELASEMLSTNELNLAILVSCVGRKLVLKQRVDEEIEVVKELLNNEAKITGFYSYGEIAPYNSETLCELHNQTMTITFFKE